MARLVLPPDIHLQAPPNLSDDLAPLLDSGIDDWGGVSPVTADHVNPERPWPALDRLRATTEAAGLTLAPRLTLYPEFALDPERWLAEPCGSRSSTPPTPKGWAAITPGARAARTAPPRLDVDTGPGRSPVEAGRPSLADGQRQRRGRGAGRGGPGQGSTRTPSSPCSAPGGPRYGRWPKWPTSSASTRWATRSPTWSTATSTTPTSAPSSAGSAPSPRGRCPSTSRGPLSARPRRDRRPGP